MSLSMIISMCITTISMVIQLRRRFYAVMLGYVGINEYIPQTPTLPCSTGLKRRFIMQATVLFARGAMVLWLGRSLAKQEDLDSNPAIP